MNSLPEFYQAQKEHFIDHCTLCGICLDVCSVYPYTNLKDFDAVEMQRKRMEFLRDGIYSQEVYDNTYTCPTCLRCVRPCPEGINMGLINEVIKYEFNQRGIEAPHAIYSCVPEKDFNFFNIMNNMQMDDSQIRWLTEVPAKPKPADILFFAGCLGHSQPDKIFVGIDILESMNVNFVTLGGLIACCSDINSVTGDAQASEAGARNLLAAFEAFRPKKVVLGCATCVYRLNKIFSQFIAHSYELVGLAQFLSQNLDRLKFKKPIKKKVTYQDVCKLGRGMGDWESPRQLLKAVPGTQFVEMRHIKENTICCGGVAQICSYKYTKHMNYKRMEEALQVGADTLITLDLGCHLALSRLENKYGIEIANLWNFLGEALGFEYQDNLKRYRLYEDVDKVMAEAKVHLERSRHNCQEVRHFWSDLMAAGF